MFYSFSCSTWHMVTYIHDKCVDLANLDSQPYNFHRTQAAKDRFADLDIYKLGKMLRLAINNECPLELGHFTRELCPCVLLTCSYGRGA